MIRLRKKEGTPLADGLYVIFRGMYQIRLRGTQECISAVSSFEELVRCGNLLIKRYRTVEQLRRVLSACEYNPKAPEPELIRRKYEEHIAVEDDLQRDWYNSLDVGEEDIHRTIRKRVELK